MSYIGAKVILTGVKHAHADPTEDTGVVTFEDRVSHD